MAEVISISDALLPNFVYESLYSKLNDPASLEKNDINVHRSYNPILQRDQITAYASVSLYDGVIIIFLDYDGKYQEIYSQKTNLITAVEFKNPTIIMTCRDESGIGIYTYNYYVIRCTENGYKVAWQGLSYHDHHNYYPQYGYQVVGGINFTTTNELVHSMLKTLYREGAQANPVNYEKIFDLYTYDKDNVRYEFMRRL